MTNTEKGCTCGYGPGPMCNPACPGYEKPPPGEITGEVTVKSAIRTRKADNASYTTFVFATTDTQPVQVLGKDNRRTRAIIFSDGIVRIGRRDSVSAGGGARLLANFAMPALENADELWVAPTGVAANVSVIQERYNESG